MLKEYPGHIQRLQDLLAEFVDTPSASEPLDRIIWMLEGRLDTFYFEAIKELKEAEADGDAVKIAAADHKQDVMSGVIRKMAWIGDKGIRDYVEKYRDVL